MDRRRAKRAEHEHRQRCKKHRPCLHPAPYIRKPAQNVRIRRCAAPRQRHAPYGRSVRGDNWGAQPRRNVMKPGERTMSHRGAEVAYLQGESDRARGVTVCLPCRRSWVRVPSAAWKYLHISYFLVSGPGKVGTDGYAEGPRFEPRRRSLGKSLEGSRSHRPTAITTWSPRRQRSAQPYWRSESSLRKARTSSSAAAIRAR